MREIRCFITSTAESERLAHLGRRRSARTVLLESLLVAERTKSNVRLVENPSLADIVFFAEWHGDDLEENDFVQRVIRTSEYRAYGPKIVVHSGKDIPRPLIPGLYPSIPKRWAPLLGCQGAPYLVDPNPFLGADVGWGGRVDRLASFVGVCAGKVLREKLLKTVSRMRWTDISVRDTSTEFLDTLRTGNSEGHDELKRQFVLDLLNAKFALCPKGDGPSSFRIFEAMQVGRAPVVIADDWSPPPGPHWDSFLIRVGERQIERLPALLHEREQEWQQRGELARAAWAEFYRPDRLGLTIVHQADQLLRTLKSRRRLAVSLAKLYVHVPRRMTIVSRKLSRKLRQRHKR